MSIEKEPSTNESVLKKMSGWITNPLASNLTTPNQTKETDINMKTGHEEPKPGLLTSMTNWITDSKHEKHDKHDKHDKHTHDKHTEKRIVSPVASPRRSEHSETSTGTPHIDQHIEHVVQDDEISVMSAAFKFGMDINEFCAINHIGMNDELYRGQKILINNPKWEHTPLPDLPPTPDSDIEVEFGVPIPRSNSKESTPTSSRSTSPSARFGSLLSGIQSVGSMTRNAVIGTVDLTKSAVVGTMDLTKNAVVGTVDLTKSAVGYMTKPITDAFENHEPNSPTEQPVEQERKRRPSAPPPMVRQFKTPELANTKQGTVLPTTGHLDKLNRVLPIRHQNATWQLIYSTREHGTSIRTLFDNSQRRGGSSLLVVQTTDESYFGAYLPDPLQDFNKYYGSGETFIFTFQPEFKTFKWTKANESFLLTNMVGGITIGASKTSTDEYDDTPEGLCAIYIDKDLMHGSSYACHTFGNLEPLSKTQDYEIVAVELWGFEVVKSTTKTAPGLETTLSMETGDGVRSRSNSAASKNDIEEPK